MVHEDHRGTPRLDWESICTSIGVDSGQCGIFDDSIYPQSKDHPDNEPFYDECCKITLGKESAGILKNGKGAVTSIGYGDGSYELFAKLDGDCYAALMLDFDLLNKREVVQALLTG